jgi:predicted nucleotidyltransferase
MKRSEAIDLLRRHQSEIAAHGVRALYLFGSTRRDEAGPNSDVDLFVDYEQGFSLLDLVAVKDEIDQILGARADVTTRGGLHPVLRDDILRDAERVF